MQRVMITVAVFVCLLTTNVRAQELEIIEVLTGDVVEFSNVEVLEQFVARSGGVLKVYNFDDVSKMEAFLGRGLEGKTEGDAEEIEAILSARFEDIGEERLNKMAAEAYMAKMLAIKFGIRSYPAVIVNRKAVIYGVSDLREVAERCKQWLRG